MTAVTVLSGKGGVAKTLWQVLMAGEASRLGIPTLIVDADPERNASTKFGVPAQSTGLGDVFEAAGAVDGSAELDIDVGAQRLGEEVLDTQWEDVDLVPAGSSLGAVAQANLFDTWLLRDLLEKAGLSSAYGLVMIDTGGRTGSLVAQAMYAADVAYAPIAPTRDAIRKALEARVRVERIQRAHPLKWAGVVLSGFDMRVGMDEAIYQEVRQQFGDEVRAVVPRRATVHEAFQLGERLGDRRDVASSNLAAIFRDFVLELRAAGQQDAEASA
ncbi:ParA family protein [Actinomycetospora chlora]|uniref:ParA family protein n=1 Tax=Actinomycetospora chlora TaxID=663608 RepID=A0ABP9AZB9_9PSEU